MSSYKLATDLDLITEAKSGNQLAFKQLVERYENRVAATVIGMLGNTPEADDIGQTVFVRFYKALNNFRGDAALSTYLTRIAINLSLNELKKRKRRRLFTFFSDTAETTLQLPDTSLSQSAKDTQEMVQWGIQQLKPDFRSVVILRMIEGYSTKETAAILEIPLGTVLSRLTRAQHKLKKILQPLQ